MAWQDFEDQSVEGQNERTSLDRPSKFTLTRFRRSKWTQLIGLLLFWVSWTR